MEEPQTCRVSWWIFTTSQLKQLLAIVTKALAGSGDIKSYFKPMVHLKLQLNEANDQFVEFFVRDLRLSLW